MENELGQGSHCGAPQPTSSENSRSETLVETGNLVEASYAEGDDGGEIMVEIVGSDVFVDGVSGTEEPNLGAAELSEAMDVSSGGGENKTGESKLELLELKGENIMAECHLGVPELEEGINNVVMGENTMGQKGSCLLDQKDGKHHVFKESVDVVSEVVGNKIGKSESGLPEVRDEKDDIANEAMDVCNEVVADKVETSELGLPKLKEEKENYDDNCSEPLNVEVEILPVQTEEATVTSPMGNSEDKTVKDKVAKDPDDKQIVSYVVSLGFNRESPNNVEVHSAIVTARVVNSEEEAIKHETVDEPTKNLDHLGSNSQDGQVTPSEASINPNGEETERKIFLVDGIDNSMVASQIVNIDGSATKDEAVDKKICKDPKQDSSDDEGHENVSVDGFDNLVREEANSFGEKGLVAKTTNLITKSDALHSNDFHDTKSESSHDRGTVEEVDALLDPIAGDLNVNPSDLSCVVVGNDETSKSGGNIEMDMVYQNHVEPNNKEPNQPGDAFHTDPVNKDEREEVLDDGRLSENDGKIVSEESKQPLGCQENDKIPNELIVEKQKAFPPLTTDGYDKWVSVYAAKVSTLTGQNTSNNKPLFKIGECIRRVASQLTGSIGNDESVINDSFKNTERRTMVLSIESFSVNEMLSRLERVSKEPMRRHDLNVIHTFFMGFRSSIALNRRGRKRKLEQTASGGPTEGFEFDDVSDSYWTDRIVQNYSELNGSVGNLHVVPIVREKPVKPSRRPNSRKRFSHLMVDIELDEQVKRRKQESLPAELILYFAERNLIPTEINLNKMFRRFGSLMESETEVDHESGCAKVIFKRGSDAEVARNSSEAFNIFGPVVVNYHIGYEPVVSVRVLPMAVSQPQEDTILMQ